jgi:hypothetical protein
VAEDVFHLTMTIDVKNVSRGAPKCTGLAQTTRSNLSKAITNTNKQRREVKRRSLSLRYCHYDTFVILTTIS